jgi:hypothetical protein
VKNVSGVCCAAVVCAVVTEVKGMERVGRMPTIAYSQNEGPELSDIHQIWVRDEIYCKYFMPRSEEELNSLYEIYTSWQIEEECSSALRSMWFDIVDVIRVEFIYRCKDGDRNIIDEYLLWFKEFVRITDNFPDQLFLEPLLDEGLFGLPNRLGWILHELDLHDELTEDAFYIVGRIDEIFEYSARYYGYALAESFHRSMLRKSEYQAFKELMEKESESGVPFDRAQYRYYKERRKK